MGIQTAVLAGSTCPAVPVSILSIEAWGFRLITRNGLRSVGDTSFNPLNRGMGIQTVWTWACNNSRGE